MSIWLICEKDENKRNFTGFKNAIIIPKIDQSTGGEVKCLRTFFQVN